MELIEQTVVQLSILCVLLFAKNVFKRTQSGNKNHSSEDIESLNIQDEGDTYDCNFVHW